MSTYLTPSRHYVPVPNTIITDTDLSPFAKMVACLLAYLLGIPDFVVTIGALRKYTGKGTATISAALSELRERGYLREGYYADVTVFDEALLRAAVPDQEKSFGIEKVFVNGQLILDGDTLNRDAAAHSGMAMPIGL